MPLLEISLVLLLGVFLLIRLRRGARLGHLVLQLLSLATGAWIAEVLTIRLLDSHHYAADWTYWADAVPVVMPAAWALVFLSAWELARALVREKSAALPWLAAGVVLIDVAVLGPLGAMIGAWRFADPGLFGVSTALPLAAAAFASAHVGLWTLLDRRELRYWYHALAIPGGAAAALAAAWAGASLGGLVAPLHPLLHLIVAWLIAAPVAAFFFAEQWQHRPRPDALPVRLAGAVASVVLASHFASETPVFLLYVLAFAMIHAALTPWDRVFGRLQAAKLFRLPARLVTRHEAPAVDSQRPRAA